MASLGDRGPGSRPHQRTGRLKAARHSRAVHSLGEALEPRVVLSGWDGDVLQASLNSIGVVTGPVLAATPSGSSSGPASQLQQDEQALRTERAGLAAGSGLTVADLTALAGDARAIARAGGRVDPKALDTAVGELATAITGHASTSQAQAAFQAAFAQTSVPASAVGQAFTDLAKAITDSGVTADDLKAVAADQAAIQSDLASLHKNGDGDSDDNGSSSGGTTGTTNSGSSSTNGTGSGSGCGSSTGSGSTSSGSSGTSSTGGGSSSSSTTSAPPVSASSPTGSTGTSTVNASAGSTTGNTSTVDTTQTSGTTTQGHSRHGRHHRVASSTLVHLARTLARPEHGSYLA